MSNAGGSEAGEESAASRGLDVAVDTVAAIVSPGAGLAAGGPEGAFLGAAVSPSVSVSLHTLGNRVRTWRTKRAGETFRFAAQLCGVSEEELALWLSGDERAAELAGRVLLVAQDATLRQKRRALAAVLAHVYEPSPAPETAYDRALLLANALESLGAPHLRLMTVMEPARRLPVDWNSERDGDDFGMRMSVAANADASLDGGIAEVAIRTLVGVGLAEDASAGIPWSERQRSYALTELGEDALALLRTSLQPRRL